MPGPGNQPRARIYTRAIGRRYNPGIIYLFQKTSSPSHHCSLSGSLLGVSWHHLPKELVHMPSLRVGSWGNKNSHSSPESGDRELSARSQETGGPVPGLSSAAGPLSYRLPTTTTTTHTPAHPAQPVCPRPSPHPPGTPTAYTHQHPLYSRWWCHLAPLREVRRGLSGPPAPPPAHLTLPHRERVFLTEDAKLRTAALGPGPSPVTCCGRATWLK